MEGMESEDIFSAGRNTIEDDLNFGESDEETITAKQVLDMLKEAWSNEKFAPEILPHKADLVECMLTQLHHMEENMKKLKKNDIRAIIHQMEIDRIRFLITDYLRTRLEKIELYTKYILDAEEQRIENETNYLSSEEYRFAQEYLSNEENLFKQLACRYMPGNLQDLDWNEMMSKPNLSSRVFFKAKKSVMGVVISDEDVDNDQVNFEENSQHILPYKYISELIKDGTVLLM